MEPPLPPKLVAVIEKIGYWSFSEDIPLHSSGAHPASDPVRVKEEIEIFNTWKKFNPTIPFSNLRYIGKNLFLVDVDCYSLFGSDCGKFKTLTISIICPPNYPRAFPRLAENPRIQHDRIFMELVTRATRRAVYLCIPAIQRIWWTKNTPYAGIAHFLNIFLIWFSISSNKKRTKIDFYDKKTVIV